MPTEDAIDGFVAFIKFMSLGILSQAAAPHPHGSFWFEMDWVLDGSRRELMWKQTSLPTETTIQGFEPLNEDAQTASVAN
eukprot:908291-Amphidinium_carterae.1